MMTQFEQKRARSVSLREIALGIPLALLLPVWRNDLLATRGISLSGKAAVVQPAAGWMPVCNCVGYWNVDGNES